MKKSPIRKVSKKQAKELYLRRKLKKLLLAEGPHDGAGNPLCWHMDAPRAECNGYPDWRGFGLVHLKYLSQCGKTEHKNCEIWCYPCHNGPDGHRTEII